jgi:asparagine synthase (glutamine-hydrolysing)
MCGIAAVVSRSAVIPDDVIDRMLPALRHRGPDGQGIERFPSCHLGHTRLSVIDLEGGAQPMRDETERYALTFNGEIFNFRELRAELVARGHRFRTRSDTEVLLRAYIEYGEDVPRRLNGQFAFAIWDQRELRLFAARDRFGEKPLYWAEGPSGSVVLCSELKGLLEAGLVRPRLDGLSVEAYLALLYVPPDRTIYENVRTLPPAHALSWRRGVVRTWRYWELQLSTNRLPPGDQIEQVRTLVRRAVTRQMVADVPVGAFLSGGLDSSTIVALMAEEAGAPVLTFSAGFGGLIDELQYARAVAERYHTQHHEVQIEIAVGEQLERMMQVYDEPFADSSNIPTYLIAAAARQHVKVVLSGDGGDEVFGGYDWYLPLLRGETMGAAEAALTIARALLRKLARRLGRDQPGDAGSTALLYKLRFPDVWRRHLAFSTGLWAGHSPLGADDRRVTALLEASYRADRRIEGIDRAADFDLRCYLPGDILVKVDRAAMAHGLEVRAPLLDVELVEHLVALSWQQRFSGPASKGLLRAAFADRWPASVRQRAKQGFGAPIWNWIDRPDVQRLWHRVSHAGAPLASVFPGLRGAPQPPQHQWTLLCLGLWLESHPECLGASVAA